MVRAPLIVFASLALCSCVTTKTSMLDERTAIISGRAHAKGAADVEHKILVEAATEARKRGFEYFQIVGTQDTTTSGVIYMPGNTTATTTGQASCYGYSCMGSATTNTTGYGPRAMPYVQPGADITVKFLHPGEFAEGTAGVWSVQSVLAAQ